MLPHLSQQHHHAEEDARLRDLQERQQMHALVLRLRTPCGASWPAYFVSQLTQGAVQCLEEPYGIQTCGSVFSLIST